LTGKEKDYLKQAKHSLHIASQTRDAATAINLYLEAIALSLIEIAENGLDVEITDVVPVENRS